MPAIWPRSAPCTAAPAGAAAHDSRAPLRRRKPASVPHERHALKSHFAGDGPLPLCPYFQDDRIMLYQSDITQFINQLKEQKPTLEEEQRRGRALLWDKQPIDLEERSAQQLSRVNQTPYVYYQNF
jgi:hypothetical protein